MAEQLSERELRLRRRERLIEELDMRKKDELERKIIERQLLREQIDQRRVKTQRLRQNQSDTCYDIDKDGSDIEDPTKFELARAYSVHDIEGFTLHNSTGVFENETDEKEYKGQSNADEIEKEIERLSIFLNEIGRDKKDNRLSRRCTDKSYDDDVFLTENSEGKGKSMDTVQFEYNGRTEEIERDKSLNEIKEQIEIEMMKEKTLKEERERQRLKEEERGKLLKTLEELRSKNRQVERGLREKEERRNEVDVKLKLGERNLEYAILLERKRYEEREIEHLVAEERMKNEREKQEEMRLFKESIRREIEDKMQKEMEMKYKETEEIERSRIEKRKKMKAKEMELMRSIEQLQIQERKLKDSKDNSDEEDDRLMETRLRHLRIEKEMLEKKITRERDETTRKEVEVDEAKDVPRLDKTLGRPKLPNFDGSQFEEWKLEVVSLMETKLYTDLILSRAVRNSLSGKARKVLMTLKPTASTEDIIKKLGDIYGNIRSGDSIIHDFYSAKQMKTESCSEWGVRIETLFYQALERGEIDESKKDSKLKERFWRGLFSEQLKNATRSAYESWETFDTLRRKTRIEELEMEIVKSGNAQSETIEDIKVCQPIQKVEETQSKLDTLLQKMKALESEIREMKTQQSRPEYRSDVRTVHTEEVIDSDREDADIDIIENTLIPIQRKRMM